MAFCWLWVVRFDLLDRSRGRMLGQDTARWCFVKCGWICGQTSWEWHLLVLCSSGHLPWWTFFQCLFDHRQRWFHWNHSRRTRPKAWTSVRRGQAVWSFKFSTNEPNDDGAKLSCGQFELTSNHILHHRWTLWPPLDHRASWWTRGLVYRPFRPLVRTVHQSPSVPWDDIVPRLVRTRHCWAPQSSLAIGKQKLTIRLSADHNQDPQDITFELTIFDLPRAGWFYNLMWIV